MEWRKHAGNFLLSALAISQLGVAGCTTMPSGPENEACLKTHNEQVAKLPSADNIGIPATPHEKILCSSDQTTFGFIAQLPNTNQLDPDVKFPGSDLGSWRLDFGTLDRNIAGQYDVPLTEPGIYKMRIAVKSDQKTNLVLLCGYPGLEGEGTFPHQESLITADKEWTQANCLFELPEGKTLNSLQVGLRAVPSDTPRNSVTVWVGPMQIVKTNLKPGDPALGEGDAEYPDEIETNPQHTTPPVPPARKPVLGI